MSAFNFVLKNLFSALLLLFITEVFTQEKSSSFLYNTNWLEASDQKDWEKALKKINDADVLLNKSNDKYLEVSSLQNSEELKEKDNKKIEKLQDEAVDISVKSLEKYKEVYLELNSMLSNLLQIEHNSHPSYSEWSSFSGQANDLYSETEKEESFERVDKLTKANELQLLALKKGIEVFVLDPQSIEKDISNENGAYSDEDFVIDNEMLQKYRQYVEDKSIPSPVTAAKLMGKEGEEASFNAFEELWQNYQTGKPKVSEVESDLATIEESDSNSIVNSGVDSPELAVYQEGKTNEQDVQSNVNYMHDESMDGGYEKNTDNATHQNKSKITESKSATSDTRYEPEFSLGENYEFRVQIAASRAALNIAQIESIYSGNLSVVELKEESYFKYQIRGYELLSDAQLVCSQAGVDNAYIEAYKDKQRKSLGIAAKENKKLQQQANRKGRERSLKQINFAVQLVASRTRLAEDNIIKLSNCPNHISIVFDEGWYKYQVFIGKKLEEAFEYLEKCSSKKSFIVAYKNGRKLKLSKAIQEYKTYTP